MNKIRVGIAGAGRISTMHLGAIAYLKDYVELVSISDIKKDRADEVARKYHCKAYYDTFEMIEKENLDIVHICTPHNLHVPIAKACFEKNIAVLSEKPISVEYEEAKEAVEIAKKKGILYGVIFQCRYNDSSQLIKKAVLDGKLGKIKSVVSTLTWTRSDEYYSSSDWKGTWDKEGGGVVIDQAIHSLDLANWIIDSDCISIDANIANRNHKIIHVEDTAEGTIKYKNGVIYNFYCTNTSGFDEPIEIKFYCEKGRAFLTYDYSYIEYNDGRREEAVTKSPDVVYEGGKDYWGFMHIKQIEQFYKAYLKQEELEITAEEALKVQKIVNSIYESGKTRKQIKFGE